MTATTAQPVEPCRVLILSTLYPPHYLGGYELICAEVTNELMRQGYECRVLCTDYAQPKPVVEGHVHRVFHHCHLAQAGIEDSKGNRIQKDHWSLENRGILRGQLDEFSPDVVFCWDLREIDFFVLQALDDYPVLAYLADYVLPQSRYLGDRRYLLSRPALKPISPWWNDDDLSAAAEYDRLEKKYGNVTMPPLGFSHHVCISEHLVNYVENMGYPRNACSVIAPMLPAEWFNETGVLSGINTKERVRRILYAGRLEHFKGVHVLIKAFGSVCSENEGLQLRIVGTGPKEYLEELILQAEGLPVQFCGRVSPQAVREEMEAADVVVVPSLYEEPFGRVALEAMATGNVVIASRVGGLGKIFEDSDEGILVEAGNVEGLSEAITRLIDEPQFFRQLATRGFHRANTCYNLQQGIRLFTDVIEQVRRQHPAKFVPVDIGLEKIEAVELALRDYAQKEKAMQERRNP